MENWERELRHTEEKIGRLAIKSSQAARKDRNNRNLWDEIPKFSGSEDDIAFHEWLEIYNRINTAIGSTEKELCEIFRIYLIGRAAAIFDMLDDVSRQIGQIYAQKWQKSSATTIIANTNNNFSTECRNQENPPLNLRKN